MSNFTKEEVSASAAKSAKVLLRLVLSLKLLKILFIPAVLLIALSTALPQFSLWLMGQYAQCGNNIGTCEVYLKFIDSKFGIDLLFLFYVILLSILIRVLAWAVFEISGQWSAQDIHQASVRALSKVRVTFFDENPSGRLINRLIKDFDNLRMGGVIRIGDLINALGDIFSATIFVSLTQPLVVFLLLPTLAVFAYVQYNIALMVHRLGFLYSSARGQFIHRETDVLEGLRQYRFFGAELALFSRVKEAARKFIEINYIRSRVEAWGRFWISSGTSAFIFSSLIALSYAVTSSDYNKASAVVLVTVLFRVTPAFTWLMWTSSYAIESVSVCQRVFGIVDLKQETEEEGPNTSTLNSQNKTEMKQAIQNLNITDKLIGDIEFKNFSMSYREGMPTILSNLSLHFPAYKRIGIIGRTGAGKSSILQSLFRMVYRQSGDITIGGESIYNYSPDFIRSHFAVVPQESYLFKGTLRTNLDPKNDFSESEVVSALSKVGLMLDLDFELQEEGGNVSAGERQLICLARALLLDRPIFVLDEPTSGLDSISDAAVQRLLKSELGGKTVIAIAHRLETLKSYDLIFEVDAGQIRKI